MPDLRKNTQEHEDYIGLPDEMFDEFQDFLDREGNSRIFFSAPYGVGKTFFLNKFFAKEKDKYEVFHLHPVNYQIASNENILNFIKYDLIVQLLDKDQTIFEREHKDPSRRQLVMNGLQEVFNNNGNKVLNVGASVGSIVIGTTTSALVPPDVLSLPLKNLRNTYLAFDRWSKEQKGNVEKTKNEFIRSLSDDAQNETDTMSAILNEKINYQKGNKESVLVLDDFDRIDPEHMFRLMNVLTAHTLEKEDTDHVKFGFDKVILVGDQNNIRHVFHHKYGPQADFKGYFDKFTSKNTYYYSPQIYLQAKILDLLTTKGYEEEELKRFEHKIFMLEDILLRLIELDQIRIRDFMLLKHFKTVMFRDYASHKSPLYLYATFLVEINKDGDKEDLIKKLNLLRKQLYQTIKNSNTFGKLKFQNEDQIKNHLQFLFDNALGTIHASNEYYLYENKYLINGTKYRIDWNKKEFEILEQNPSDTVLFDNKQMWVREALFVDLWIEYIRKMI